MRHFYGCDSIEDELRQTHSSVLLLPYGTSVHGTIVIRKYGSTFYIGIAMVVLPYFGPWENLN